MGKIVKNLILAIIILLILPFPISAAPTVLINGQSINLEVSPQIINDRVMVPMGSIFSALGADVTWMGDAEQTILAKKNTTLISLKVGSTRATVNGAEVTLDSPPLIINGRTLVPLGFIAKALGVKVAWDGATETVSLIKRNDPEDPNLTPTEIAKQVKPALVIVFATDFNCKVIRYGEGVALSSDGRILVPYSVIRGGYFCGVIMPDNKQILEASTVVSYDRVQNFAIVYVGLTDRFKYVPIGDSDKLESGQKVLAVGCTEGLENTWSEGLISAMGREYKRVTDLFQVSAPINTPEMGGFIFNLKGELVGMAFAGKSGAQELNFINPVNKIKELVNKHTYSKVSDVTLPDRIQ